MKVRKAVFLLAVTAIAAAVLSATADESLTQRRARVERMAAEQKRALSDAWERFRRLSEEKRGQLRRLHEDLAADSDRLSLEAVLARYSEWIATLPPYTQAELLDLPPEARIARVRELRDEEALRTLSPEDQKALFMWLVRRVRDGEKPLSPEELEKLKRLDPGERRARVEEFLRHGRRRMFTPGQDADYEKGLAELRADLSPRVRELMEKKSTREQGRLVFQWIMDARSPSSGRPPFAGPMEQPSPAELEEFFLRLSAEDRDRLLQLPSEAMNRELRQLYWQRRFPRPPDGRGPGPMGSRQDDPGSRRGGFGEGPRRFEPPSGEPQSRGPGPPGRP